MSSGSLVGPEGSLRGEAAQNVLSVLHCGGGGGVIYVLIIHIYVAKTIAMKVARCLDFQGLFYDFRKNVFCFFYLVFGFPTAFLFQLLQHKIHHAHHIKCFQFVMHVKALFFRYFLK